MKAVGWFLARLNDAPDRGPARERAKWPTLENCVWKAAHKLALDADRISVQMRGAQVATLRDQLVRAAMSVPTNIVEGCAHASDREFARFLRYSLASVTEVEGHALLARDLGIITNSDFQILLTAAVDVRMMLHGLIKRVKSRDTRRQ